MKKLGATLLLLLLASAYAFSDGVSVYPSGSAVLPGTFTVSTLPDPTQNQARYAFVTDLGGGADMVVSDGANWKHIRPGIVTPVAVATSVPVTPLSSPPIMQLSGNAFVGSASIAINPTNLYPGYTLHIIVPSGVLSTAVGLLGTLGVNANGGPSLPLIGGTWEDVQWNGASLIELGRGTL